MGRIRQRKCLGCGTSYDLFEWQGELLAQDRPASEVENISCPGCDSVEFREQITVPTPIEMGGEHGVGKRYPYYDNGLNTEVRSKKHHAWLMDHLPNGQRRNVPLVPVEGDIDMERETSHIVEEKQKIRQDYKDLQAQQRHEAPELYGIIDEMKKDHQERGVKPDPEKLQHTLRQRMA